MILDDNWQGGETLNKGANEDAVGLPLGASFKFTTFTEAAYTTLLGQVKDGTIVVPATETELAAFLTAHAGNPSVADLVAKTNS